MSGGRSGLAVGDENDAKLQKIASLDFHYPKTGKTKGKIIWGIILMFLGGLWGSSQPDMSKWWFIFCYALCLLGLFLFIRGIVTGKKNKKAQIEAAQYNFKLVKSIVYTKSSEETTDDDKKSAEEKISDLCKKVAKWELDPDTAEQIIFLGSDENDTDLDFDSDTDDDEIDYSESNEDKIKKAKESFGISNSETILFGYDDTLKKSFKTGFVLTEKTLYFTDGNSFTKNTSISVAEINSITLTKKLGVAYICVNDSCISISLSSRKDSEKLCEMLNKAVKILQKEKSGGELKNV